MTNLEPSRVFSISKNAPVTVSPATPTPNELKPLSDIDDQRSLRKYSSGLHIYRASAAMNGVDPVAVLLDALPKALVFYYPLAGRLRELPGQKLAIDCTAEGVAFVAADANFTIDEFSDGSLQPPFPFLDQLVHGIGADVLTSPLVFMQLTRMRCGGFILSHSINHNVMDAAGIMQFLKAVGEIASGASSPSVLPVWARELLMARDAPQANHQQPDEPSATPLDSEPMVLKSFFFGTTEVAALRQKLPRDMKSTRFELLTACLWLCHVAALETPPDLEVRLRIVVGARHNMPIGFYGNAQAAAVARATVAKLEQGQLEYAINLIKEAKRSVAHESVADLMVIRARPRYTSVRTFVVSDITRLGFEGVDFGWGEAVYAGPAIGYSSDRSFRSTYLMRHINGKGEVGILVPMKLPASTMERFDVKVDQMLAPMELPASTMERFDVKVDQMLAPMELPASTMERFDVKVDEMLAVDGVRV